GGQRRANRKRASRRCAEQQSRYAVPSRRRAKRRIGTLCIAAAEREVSCRKIRAKRVELAKQYIRAGLQCVTAPDPGQMSLRFRRVLRVYVVRGAQRPQTAHVGDVDQREQGVG